MIDKPLLGAYMIVKNEEAQILDCLNSILPICDEIVIVDTGSDDRTMELIESLHSDKIVVYTYIWENDFSKARNFAMSKSNATYTFTTDADEVFTEELQSKIISLKESQFDNRTSIELYILNKNKDAGDSFYLGGRQIVLNKDSNNWMYRIHEKLYYDESNPLTIPYSEGYIIHNKKSGVATSNYDKYAESYFNEINSGDATKNKLAHYYYYLFFTIKNVDRLTAVEFLQELYNPLNLKSKSEDQRLNLYADNYISYEELYVLSLIGANADPKLVLDAAKTWPYSNYAEYVALEYAYSKIDMLNDTDASDVYARFAYSSYMVGNINDFIFLVNEFIEKFPSSDIAKNDKSFVDSYLIPFKNSHQLVIECDNVNQLPSTIYRWSQYFDSAIFVTDKKDEIISDISIEPFENVSFVQSIDDIKSDKQIFKIKSSLPFTRDSSRILFESAMYGK